SDESSILSSLLDLSYKRRRCQIGRLRESEFLQSKERRERLLFHDSDSMDNLIRRAEMEAYNSILRAFRYQSNELSWEKEMLLTDLRKELRISDDYHRDLLDRLNHDVTLRCI
ncbi:Protein EMSY-LIKE 1, partial [Mucuna pruriens]